MFSICCTFWSLNEIAEPGINLDSLGVSFLRERPKKIKLFKSLRYRLGKTFALPVDFALRTFDQDYYRVDVCALTLIDETTHRFGIGTDSRWMRPQCVNLTFRLDAAARIRNTRKTKQRSADEEYQRSNQDFSRFQFLNHGDAHGNFSRMNSCRCT